MACGFYILGLHLLLRRAIFKSNNQWIKMQCNWCNLILIQFHEKKKVHWAWVWKWLWLNNLRSWYTKPAHIIPQTFLLIYVHVLHFKETLLSTQYSGERINWPHCEALIRSFSKQCFTSIYRSAFMNLKDKFLSSSHAVKKRKNLKPEKRNSLEQSIWIIYSVVYYIVNISISSSIRCTYCDDEFVHFVW